MEESCKMNDRIKPIRFLIVWFVAGIAVLPAAAALSITAIVAFLCQFGISIGRHVIGGIFGVNLLSPLSSCIVLLITGFLHRHSAEGGY